MNRIACFVLMILMSTTNVFALSQKGCRKVTPIQISRSGIFTTNGLEGRILGDLYIAYTGVQGRVPAKVTVDPVRQLDSLWRVKIACYKEAEVVRTLHKEVLDDYRSKRTHITLKQFIASAESEVQLVRREIQWNLLQSAYKLTDEELSLVRSLSLQIGGEDLVAYGMTEIMPSADGPLNIEVLDFLVRNYGPEFVYSIPAIHDKYASFGFYQFTSYAVYDGPKRVEGASKVSRTMREGKIPGSTMQIRGTLQHRAAYLFAINNITLMVKALSKKERAVIRRLPERNHDDLIQFVAASHNVPVYARQASRRWLDANMKYDFYISMTNSAGRQYAVKTKANLAALRSHQF